jgi:hypothetical protein
MYGGTNRLERKAILESFRNRQNEITDIIHEGLRHISISLGLEELAFLQSMFSKGTGRQKPDSDGAESRTGPAAGSAPVVPEFQKRLDDFYEKRETHCANE